MYTLAEIEELCRRPVVVFLFRHCRTVRPILPSEQLARMAVFKRPPQSVMQITNKGLSWIREALAA